MVVEKTDYNYIIQALNDAYGESKGEERIEQRVEALYKRAISFLKLKGYKDDVAINDELLRATIIDYFADIIRLKEFSSELKHTNYQKIYAYTAYWWLRRKPIQIIKNNDQVDLSYVNEDFLAYYIVYAMSRIIVMQECEDIAVIDLKNEIVKQYINSLKYFSSIVQEMSMLLRKYWNLLFFV